MQKINIEELRKLYPKGARVILLYMDDTQAPPLGTKGTIVGVDDIGQVLVNWDNGSSLSLVVGVDKFAILKPVTTICYDCEKVWKSREEAMLFFTECYLLSEGAENERYASILRDLEAGLDVCKDS